ncbi:MAG TPA: cbb3-type cytochrome oxidase assembly protein CcoS [Noviherbaspirillum sp.]
MEALYLLVPMSVALVFLAIWIFFRASDSGQFDDLVGPGMRILQDVDRVARTGEAEAPQTAQDERRP